MAAKDPLVVAAIARIIAKELGVGEGQVAATIQLIEEGASIPFIARYRKERTGGLDDTQLRTLAERFEYLTILNDRREVVLRSIREQDKLTPELEKQIRAAHDESRTRRSLRPLSPQAPHQGERRPRSRARAAGRSSACQSEPRSRRRSPRLHLCPTRASRMPTRRSKARAAS